MANGTATAGGRRGSAGRFARRRATKRAGASASREYERLKKQWRAKHRRFFGGLALVFLVVFVATYVPSRHHVLIYFGGMLSGALLAALVALRESPPPWIENYQVGAFGEQRTAKALQPLLDAGWIVLHDLNRFKFNFDHVLIGPGGVYVLDTKNAPGSARADGNRLRITRPDGRRGYDGDELAGRAPQSGRRPQSDAATAVRPQPVGDRPDRSLG